MTICNTRKETRNRNKIQTPNGLQWLTIPVMVKGNYFQKIYDTKISDKNWKNKHWNFLKLNYSKARFFKEYDDFFEDMYLSNKDEYLSEINYKFIVAINEILGISTKVRWSSDFDLINGKSEKLLGICKDCNANVYFTGPASKDYLDENILNKII